MERRKTVEIRRRILSRGRKTVEISTAGAPEGGSRRLEVLRRQNIEGEFVVIVVSSSKVGGRICIPASEFGNGWMDLANVLSGFDLSGEMVSLKSVCHSNNVPKSQTNFKPNEMIAYLQAASSRSWLPMNCEVQSSVEGSQEDVEVIPSSYTVIPFLREKCLVGASLELSFREDRCGCFVDKNKPEALWVRVLGLPIFLWSEELFRALGDRCGGYIVTAEETIHRHHTKWARICVKGTGSSIPTTVSIGMGSLVYSCPIWVESCPREVRWSEPSRYCDGNRWREMMGEGDSHRGVRYAEAKIPWLDTIDSTRPKRTDQIPAKHAVRNTFSKEKGKVLLSETKKRDRLFGPQPGKCRLGFPMRRGKEERSNTLLRALAGLEQGAFSSMAELSSTELDGWSSNSSWKQVEEGLEEPKVFRGQGHVLLSEMTSAVTIQEEVDSAIVPLVSNQIEPIATLDPREDKTTQIDRGVLPSDRGIDLESSAWARRKLKGFGKFLGISYGGMEDEVARSKGMRELKKFEWSVSDWSRKGRGRSWSRGPKGERLNDPDKRKVVKGLLNRWKCTVVYLQETAPGCVDRSIVRSLWGSRRVEWECLRVEGASGGILLMWDSSVYGPHNRGERLRMREELSGVRASRGTPWGGPAPFRFENMQLQVEGFRDLIRKWWVGHDVIGNPSFRLARKLQLLKEDLQRWNREVFERIEIRLASLTEELKALESKDHCLGLSETERVRRAETQAKFGRLLMAEETSWRQKYRATLLSEGARNTAFFHRVANANRKINYIGKIGVDGVLHEDQDSLVSGIVRFYENEYKEPEQWRPRVDGLGLPSLSSEEAELLVRPIEEEEVSEVVMKLSGDKAQARMSSFRKRKELLKSVTIGQLVLLVVFYKVLAKVLTRRMAKVMDKLISENQNAFVGGRQILNASLVAKECVDGCLRSNEPGVLCKLDIKKAFDHVSWDFLLYLLERLGFGGKWCKWIKGCISSMKFSDCQRVGQRFISRAMSLGSLSGFKIGEGSQEVTVSHLLFADDTLILCNADSGELACLRDILLCFQAVSGLKINLAKSELIQVGDGIDLRSLVEALGRNSGSENTPGIHLVAWKELFLPKKGEGLGVRDLVLFNKALLGKWIWRFAQGDDKPWCRVIKGKYGIIKRAWRTKDITHSHGSSIWKGIMKVWGNFRPHISYQLGNGRNISFWHDDWCGHMPLQDRFPKLFALATHQDATVADCWIHSTAGGVWAPLFRRGARDWELEAFVDLFKMLQGVLPISQEVDKWRWKRHGKGSFTVSSFYHSITGSGDPTFPWKGIWVSRVLSKVCFCEWTTAKGAILTIDNLWRRRMLVTNSCYMCKRNAETTDHLLIHCVSACELWSLVFSIFGVQWVMPRSVRELFAWLNQESCRGSHAASLESWSLCLFWCIWHERNLWAFEGQKIPSFS
ncbi:hypothetical protein Acr_01g0011420 [Actinidia rufa]|uniref:Reverse transcriptase domain-containing protein n=1 Tax=Actinidia rufa TaxID=165716 RepID=A0A7J0E4A6_9ERIC|nr:hypothetical protein Acr_01g0011420 [Actinidia rufa]